MVAKGGEYKTLRMIMRRTLSLWLSPQGGNSDRPPRDSGGGLRLPLVAHVVGGVIVAARRMSGAGNDWKRSDTPPKGTGFECFRSGYNGYIFQYDKWICPLLSKKDADTSFYWFAVLFQGCEMLL